MNEKYTVKTKKLDYWVRTEIRFLKEGISISDEYRSILIKYSDVTNLNLDQNLILTLLYTSDNSSEKIFSSERIDCNKNVMRLISKKTGKRIKKMKNENNGLLKDTVILIGKCKFQDNMEENTYYLTHKKIIILVGNKQIIFNISNIIDLNRIDNNIMKFTYGYNDYQIYFRNVDQIILYIKQNKAYTNNYADNIDLFNPKLKEKRNKMKKINIFIYIILILIILVIAYFIYKGM